MSVCIFVLGYSLFQSHRLETVEKLRCHPAKSTRRIYTVNLALAWKELNWLFVDKIIIILINYLYYLIIIAIVIISTQMNVHEK